MLNRLNNKLELLPLQKRRERKRYSIIHFWKILSNLALNDVDREFVVHQRLGINAKIPTMTEGTQLVVRRDYDKTFRNQGYSSSAI